MTTSKDVQQQSESISVSTSKDTTGPTRDTSFSVAEFKVWSVGCIAANAMLCVTARLRRPVEETADMVRRMASFKLADIPEGERGPYEEALEELLRDTDVVVYTRQLTGAVTRSVA